MYFGIKKIFNSWLYCLIEIGEEHLIKEGVRADVVYKINGKYLKY